MVKKPHTIQRIDDDLMNYNHFFEAQAQSHMSHICEQKWWVSSGQ